MKIAVVGVYPVDEAREPCHLIELLIEGACDGLRMAEFTQEVPGQPRDNRQVPWDEYVLSADGTSGELVSFPGPLNVVESARVAFFFHYLDLSEALQTPAGPTVLPEPTRCPSRLAFIKYEPPD